MHKVKSIEYPEDKSCDSTLWDSPGQRKSAIEALMRFRLLILRVRPIMGIASSVEEESVFKKLQKSPKKTAWPRRHSGEPRHLI